MSFTIKTDNDISNRFQSINDSQKCAKRIGTISANLQTKFKDVAQYVNSLLPESRETSLCLTKLEEGLFYANASLVRNGIKEPDDH